MVEVVIQTRPVAAWEDGICWMATESERIRIKGRSKARGLFKENGTSI